MPVKERSKKCPSKIITDAEYPDDITLLANTLAQAESLLHSLEQAAGDRSFYNNAAKTEYMCFNKKCDIYTLKCGPLKLVDEFTHPRSSVSST